MADRRIPFTREQIDRGDSKATAQVAHCSVPGCEKAQAIFNQKGSRVIPPALFRRKLTQHGWEIRGVDLYCPTHKHHVHTPNPPFPALRLVAPPSPKETKPMAERLTVASFADLGAAAAAERLMTPEHKRKINREIFNNWDDAKVRYIGDMTDQKISTQLSVPRAWVEQVRIELFGDSGGNEEIDALRTELDATISKWEPQVIEAARAVENAMNKVGEVERLMTNLKELRKRLERVEVATLPRR
jgi:hypothetical protein